MKERPILFKAAMVNAIMAGTKTQTRRIVKDDWWFGCLTGDCPHDHRDQCAKFMRENCPYGAIGDRLWVREHLKCGETSEWYYAADKSLVQLPDDHPQVLEMVSWAHHNEKSYCSPIHMPRWACRIDLEITDVRVEQLQTIWQNEGDCYDEGAQSWAAEVVKNGNKFPSVRHAYRALWESINGPDSWNANPWVWVLSFKRVAR